MCCREVRRSERSFPYGKEGLEMMVKQKNDTMQERCMFQKKTGKVFREIFGQFEAVKIVQKSLFCFKYLFMSNENHGII